MTKSNKSISRSAYLVARSYYHPFRKLEPLPTQQILMSACSGPGSHTFQFSAFITTLVAGHVESSLQLSGAKSFMPTR
ncbi:hypothetical protein CY34DRAFT_568664 [Suillus luteus UH-Slu-Lm8-n1]|uniref:Unplaced genomic scaffold CY34scaffold_481, whole genome shotgun sequence n=1 Tax=Suillus luteus UH-Slu-Lm8-n1 TaxID=930992 RepID=A0A0C9ZDI1_9AGAM|nr:hypothetical protein CY34DRAFT_568664 [Suillus luteus UH-Slu-Lm8-n1]